MGGNNSVERCASGGSDTEESGFCSFVKDTGCLLSRPSSRTQETPQTPQVSIEELSKAFGSPIHAAAVLGNAKDIDALVKNGHPANLQDLSGRTPTHMAALTGNLEALQSLVKNGADLELEDRNGNTPLQAAVGSDQKKVVQWIKWNLWSTHEMEATASTPQSDSKHAHTGGGNPSSAHRSLPERPTQDEDVLSQDTSHLNMSAGSTKRFSPGAAALPAPTPNSPLITGITTDSWLALLPEESMSGSTRSTLESAHATTKQDESHNYSPSEACFHPNQAHLATGSQPPLPDRDHPATSFDSYVPAPSLWSNPLETLWKDGGDKDLQGAEEEDRRGISKVREERERMRGLLAMIYPSKDFDSRTLDRLREESGGDMATAAALASQLGDRDIL